MSTKDGKIQIRQLPIRLGQFLKLADLVQDGIEAKLRIQNEEVLVNNEVETRRGRQLQDRDRITLDGKTWIVELEK